MRVENTLAYCNTELITAVKVLLYMYQVSLSIHTMIRYEQFLKLFESITVHYDLGSLLQCSQPICISQGSFEIRAIKALTWN